MVDGFYKTVRTIISQLGYEYLTNAKGSHEKWRSRETGKIILLPRHLLSRHTANAILKEAGSDKRL